MASCSGGLPAAALAAEDPDADETPDSLRRRALDSLRGERGPSRLEVERAERQAGELRAAIDEARHGAQDPTARLQMLGRRKAAQALGCLTAAQLEEFRQLKLIRVAAPVIEWVLCAVCTLLELRQLDAAPPCSRLLSWADARQLLFRPELVPSLAAFDASGLLQAAELRRLLHSRMEGMCEADAGAKGAMERARMQAAGRQAALKSGGVVVSAASARRAGPVIGALYVWLERVLRDADWLEAVLAEPEKGHALLEEELAPMEKELELAEVRLAALRAAAEEAERKLAEEMQRLREEDARRRAEEKRRREEEEERRRLAEVEAELERERIRLEEEEMERQRVIEESRRHLEEKRLREEAEREAHALALAQAAEAQRLLEDELARQKAEEEERAMREAEAEAERLRLEEEEARLIEEEEERRRAEEERLRLDEEQAERLLRDEAEAEWDAIMNAADTPLEILIPVLVTTMVSDDDDSVAAAVMRLALAIDECEDIEQTQILGALFREHNGIEALLAILQNSAFAEEVHQSALLILGNLGSDTVDVHAQLTRQRVKLYGGFDVLLEYMQSPSETTIIYALGAVQNICSIDVEFAHMCRGEHAVVAHLRALSESENDRVRHYAVNCIQEPNIERTNQREDILSAREAAGNPDAPNGVGGAIIATH
ncbi:hypothetical protein AB1Y20_016044 [Prymnesium parvum]|uniref:Uncharacterized protein n=1 Tax=Prymnesium parvum TaxID=97485 RepID=A0AB34K081_PRYPA